MTQQTSTLPLGWLCVRTPGVPARWWPVDAETRLTCGRGQRMSIVVDDPLISRHHLTFLVLRRRVWARDEDSKNGTLLNGARLQGGHALRIGDRLALGGVVIEFHAPDAHSRSPPPGRADASLPSEFPVGVPAPSSEYVAGTQGVTFPGTTGRWQEVRLVGRGGMGEVYRVADKDLDEVVALKRLRRSDAARVRWLERLHAREAALGRAIRHPNVVRTLEDGIHDGDPYLLMEWVEGLTLEAHAKQHRPFRDECLEILRQIALGLEAAHAVGIVHADLKPANVLIVPPPVSDAAHSLAILEDPDAAPSSASSPSDDLDVGLREEIERRLGTAGSVLPALIDRPPFVGREAELELLVEALREVETSGQARWVLLHGARGVGKRRLAEEFRARHASAEIAIIDLDDAIPDLDDAHAPGLILHLLPPQLLDDSVLRQAVARARRAGRVVELHLQPFLRGQSVQLIERLVHHAASARAFVQAVEDETGGHPQRLLDAFQRALEGGAWTPSGASFSFRLERFRPDAATSARLTLERLSSEEKGLRDLLTSMAPLGNALDFELIRQATGTEPAALYYLLEHAVKQGYLWRDPAGSLHFASTPLRTVLARRLEPRVRQALGRRALPHLAARLHGAAPLELFEEVVNIEREQGRPERAFRCALQGALRARCAYSATAFMLFVDQARELYRASVMRKGAAHELQDAQRAVLGEDAVGLSGIDRLRALPVRIVVKLTDFGIARRSGEPVASAAGNSLGEAQIDPLPGATGGPGTGSLDEVPAPALPWGTPRYMSPEQALQRALTPASDMYTLGILARELLEGRHPLGDLRGAAAAQHIARQGVALPTLGDGHPEPLRRLLAELLARDPLRRPSAGEVAARLQTLQLASGRRP